MTFTEAIARQCVGSTAKKAALKRNRGNALEEARDLLWLYRFLPRRNEAAYYLVATLLAGDQAALDHLERHEALPEGPRNLGATLDLLEKERHPKENEEKRRASAPPDRTPSPIERRLRRLVDARLEPDGSGELPHLLRQIVALILSQRSPTVRIDWRRLQEDLLAWNRADRIVQKEWARAFYGVDYAGAALADAGMEDTASDNGAAIDIDEN